MDNTLPKTHSPHRSRHVAFPAHFAPLIALFSKSGYETLCRQHPTFDSRPPFKNVLDDVGALGTALTKLVEVDKKDVIVIIRTQAVTKVLSKVRREKKGK
jgi:hypothetical protein